MIIPPVIFFDLDNTLVDHSGALREALRRVCARWPAATNGSPFDDVHRRFEQINDGLWLRMAAGELTPAELRLERFRQLVEDLETAAVAPTPGELSERYMHEYVQSVRPYEGVLALMGALASRHVLGIISNGFVETQRMKLERTGLAATVTHQVYSEEVGASKPDEAIFRFALERAGIEPGEALMIGDSFVNDIAGAAAAGLRTVWLNPAGSAPTDPGPAMPDAIVGSIEELTLLLTGRATTSGLKAAQTLES